ncbi:hypothetical protein JCM16358_23970 [Halanaerocella petrolearia]
MTNIELAARDYLKKYKVDDIYYCETEILFILESPHTQEVKHGYPVAGNSGVEMAHYIYNTDEPFGKLVAKKDEYETDYNQLEKFGLLNVGSAPMQSQALGDYSFTPTEKDVLEILEKLRVNYKAKQHQKDSWNSVKEIILDDFKERLHTALQESEKIKYLVPCGKFAASYLDLIKDSIEIIREKEIITGIPHPSFNQWRKYDSMENLEEILPKI